MIRLGVWRIAIERVCENPEASVSTRGTIVLSSLSKIPQSAGHGMELIDGCWNINHKQGPVGKLASWHSCRIRHCLVSP